MKIIKLKLEKTEGYNYYFKNDFGEDIKLNIELYNASLEIGDYLLIGEDIILENVPLNFEVSKTESDIKIVSKNGIIDLRRIYG